MFDSHVHSHHSHDAVSSIEDICRTSVEKGIAGVAVCDHADMWFYERQNTYEGFSACIREILNIRDKYEGTLKIMQGIELAEDRDEPEKAAKLLALCQWDVILGSVHSVAYKDINDAYSRVDFGAMAEEKIEGFLHEYFRKMTDMARNTDFDVLTHLTCPLRYITGKYGRNIDIFRFEEEIREIFRLIRERGIALEVNTSGIGTAFGAYMPTIPLLALYREMGGELLTIGSDAHTPERLGFAFAETKKMLRDLGFSTYCYHENRKAQFVVL